MRRLKMRGFFTVTATLVAMNLLYAVVNSAPGTWRGKRPREKPRSSWQWTTTALPGTNLNGKMMTLTLNKGSAVFFPPNYEGPGISTPTPYPIGEKETWYWNQATTWPYPYHSRRYRWRSPYPTQRYPRANTPSYPYPTRHYPWHYPYRTRHYPKPTTPSYPYPTRHYPQPTTPSYPYPTRHYPQPTTPSYPYPTRHYPRSTTPSYPYPTRHYWTTSPPPTRGVSVCVRYLTDFMTTSETPLFTLSPSRNPLSMSVNRIGEYLLTLDPYSYYKQRLRAVVRLWPDIGPDVWTRVCLTVDSRNKVVQVFSGASMSIRKITSLRYSWTGEPVIDFSGFDGQMTDLQMWNYPLRYKDIFSYMAGGYYGSYRGNVLTWSSIKYSVRGDALLEDSYERRASAKSDRKLTRGLPRGHRKSGWFVGEDEREDNQPLL